MCFMKTNLKTEITVKLYLLIKEANCDDHVPRVLNQLIFNQIQIKFYFTIGQLHKLFL